MWSHNWAKLWKYGHIQTQCFVTRLQNTPRPFMKQPARTSPASFHNRAEFDFFFFFNLNWFKKRILWMFPASALWGFSFPSLRPADFSSAACVTVCEVFTSRRAVGGWRWTGSQPADDPPLCLGWNQRRVRYILSVCELTVDSTRVDLMFVADTKPTERKVVSHILTQTSHPQIFRLKCINNQIVYLLQFCFQALQFVCLTEKKHSW